jgi:hypothetical protein
MKKWLILLLAALMALTIGFVACGGDDEDEEEDDWGGDGLCSECSDSRPDPESLKLTVPGYTDSKKSKSKSEWDSCYETGHLGDYACMYDQTVDMCRAVNGWILGYLGALDEIISYPATSQEDGYCVWGPFDNPWTPQTPSEARFRMKKQSESTFDYYWEEREDDTEDPWSQIWGGEVDPKTSTNRRGVGNFWIDFTAGKELDFTRDAEGRIDVEYDTFTNDQREMTIAFDQFKATDFDVPTDGSYYYLHLNDDSGQFEFNFLADIQGGEYTGEELFSFFTQWQGDGAGTSTVFISGGDMSDQTQPDFENRSFEALLTCECWDENYQRVYFKQSARFTDDSPNADLGSEGNPMACVINCKTFDDLES